MNFLESSENITPPFWAGPISIGHYPCIWIIYQGWGGFTGLLYFFSRNDIFRGFGGFFFSNCITFIFFIGSCFCSWNLRSWNCSSCLLASCLSSLLAASVGRTSPQSWPLLRMMTGWLLSSLSQLGTEANPALSMVGVKVNMENDNSHKVSSTLECLEM